MIKGGHNPYSKSLSKRLFKTIIYKSKTYKSKKRNKSRKAKGKKNKTKRAVRSHNGRPVNKLA